MAESLAWHKMCCKVVHMHVPLCVVRRCTCASVCALDGNVAPHM
jgi:hypothetical protein